ncbi:hypothetical protein B7494_g4495 [Chlorociboria aeruginascens]|nr:hypothetical protein B7494_g4495 [Chlorociboria aeruginascens]
MILPQSSKCPKVDCLSIHRTSANNETVISAEWPPRSPEEVLLSTPSGRDRLRRLAARTSPSPSPTRMSTTVRQKSRDLLRANIDAEGEEDEETLELQLLEIQARLKLKKLQKAKQTSDTEETTIRAGSVPPSRAHSAAAIRAQSRISSWEDREQRLQRSKSQNNIHVPVSPVKRVQQNEPQRSPGRVLLGIDKGLKGSDISLGRAPSLRKILDKDFEDTRRTGPFLQRANSQARGRISALGQDPLKSFSERMAAIRSQDTERKEREARIKKNRSMAFDIDHSEMEKFRNNAVEFPNAPLPTPEFSRDEVLNSYTNPAINMARSKTTSNLRSAMRTTSSSTAESSTRSASQASSENPSRKRTDVRSKKPPGDVPELEASQFEPYSSTHLSKRIVPHKVLARTLAGKKTFVIPDLLKTVKAPDFSGPEIEEDVVVFGIIASKSEPRCHQSASKNEKRGKYMVMQLTDLKWELELYLFDSAFEKFWKLTPGTIIAILNPGFMPPLKTKIDTGKFSLTLNSTQDTILEIGSARDLGFCKSVKKDGKTCDTWVDKRHTEFCDYHVNETLKKTHSERMEVNTMNFGSRNRNGGPGQVPYLNKKEAEKKTRYDQESHSRIYIGKSSVNLLDDVDFDPDAFHRGSSKEERVTQRLLAQEKERNLAKKLGQMGGGLGADYMRRKAPLQLDPNSENTVEAPPPDATTLGLLGSKGKDIHLSPIKRKRTNAAVSSTAAVGWGGTLTKELGRMKEGESLHPVRKKTRFVTEKGIREAGRESFGGEVAKAATNDIDDDDDDDLDIVRE